MVVINNGNETKNMEISVWELGISRTKIQKFKQLMVTGDFGYSLVKKIHRERQRTVLPAGLDAGEDGRKKEINEDSGI